MEFQARVLRTGDVQSVMRDAWAAEHEYGFSTRCGMPSMNNHIRAWLHELFHCGRAQDSTVYFDLDNPPDCGRKEWLQFTGWLPQLRIRLVFLAAPQTPLPAWVTVLICGGDIAYTSTALRCDMPCLTSFHEKACGATLPVSSL